MERKFEIIGTFSLGKGKVALLIAPLKEEQPSLKNVIKPEFQTEEARIGYEIGLAMIDGMSKAGIPMGTLERATARPQTIRLEITTEEYAKIGSPIVGSILILEVSIKVK